MRRWVLVVGLSAALAGGAVIGLSVASMSPGKSAVVAPVAAAAPATAKVTRGRLIDTKTVTGTLRFTDPVALKPATSDPQRITWIAPVDSIVERGRPLYSVDGDPVVLLYGAMPLYRTLRFDAGGGDAGPTWVELETATKDVAQAELTLALERERMTNADTALTDASARLADGLRPDPQTPEFRQLARAVAAAEMQVKRVTDLVAAKVTPSVQLETAETEMVTARANLDRAIDTARKQIASSKLDLATARVSVAKSERDLQNQRDRLKVLQSKASDDTDIRQLQENLTALGYTGALPEMVRAWQMATGMPTTGVVSPRQVVVAPGPVRIAEQKSAIGDLIVGSSPDRTTILTYTSTERLVTVPLSVSDQRLAAFGAPVTVTLPDDKVVDGTISTVGSVVTDGKIDVKVTIGNQAELGSLNAASVDVEFVSDQRNNVLSVPVAALLALPDRAMGVEVVDGTGSARIVPVRVGLFASGRVEISGDGIAEGALVGVPR